MNGVQRSFQPSMKFSMAEMSCLTLVKGVAVVLAEDRADMGRAAH